MVSKYQVMPPLSDEQYAALKADIAAAGVRVPIEVDERGEIIDGHHRKAIAAELGKECPEVVIRGLEEFEKVDRAFVLNATRRHFDREQKRAVVAKSLKLHPRLADREHARRCGVSHPTVAGLRAALEAAGQLESFTSRVGGDGRERPAHNEPTTSSPAAQPEEDRPGSTDPGEAEDSSSAADAAASAEEPSEVAPRTSGEAVESEESAGLRPSDSTEREQGTTGVASSAPAAEHSGGSGERGQTAASVPAPPRKTFDQALDELVPDDDPHRKWRGAWLKAIKNAWGPASFSVSDICANGDDGTFSALIDIRDFYDELLTKVQAERIRIAKAEEADLPDNVTPIRRTA